MKLLVIIVTYNGTKWLERCLSSVVSSTIPADLFIVDNGSSDSSVNYIKENYPDANLIISPNNLGFGKANNLGIQFAVDNGYDYIYLLNQDAWVNNNTFEVLIEANIRNKQFGILSPLQTNSTQTKLDHNFAYFCPKELNSDFICHQDIQAIYCTDFVMAAHWLISRECFCKVGGFSPAFPHYGEDNNYIDRAVFHGFKVGICPSAVGVHDRERRPTSTQKLMQQMKMTMVDTLSNPLFTDKKKIRRMIKNITDTASVSFFKTFPILIYLLRNKRKIDRFKEISTNPGAFIKL